MAQYEPAFDFMMLAEDATRSGGVTSDPSAAFPSAVARLGINSGAHPEAVAASFYTMPLAQALEYAVHLYRVNYWEPILGPQILDQDVANKVFDLSVNEGAVEITKIVQRAVNSLNPSLDVDGRMGAITVAAINATPRAELLAAIKDYAIQFYRNWAFRTNQRPLLLEALIARVNR